MAAGADTFDAPAFERQEVLDQLVVARERWLDVVAGDAPPEVRGWAMAEVDRWLDELLLVRGR